MTFKAADLLLLWSDSSQFNGVWKRNLVNMWMLTWECDFFLWRNLALFPGGVNQFLIGTFTPVSSLCMIVYYYRPMDSPSDYSLNGHPSGPENWPFFQRSQVCTWQCRTLKCSATHPAFSPVRNISRLFYFIFLLCQNQFQLQHSRRKRRPLRASTLSRRISQLIVGELTLRSGACFGTFLRLRFRSSLRQVRDEDSEENEKKETTYTPPFQFHLWTCLVRIPGKTMPWGILFLRLLECMDFVAFRFHLESCSVKVFLNWHRKVNWTFWYQIWVDRGWLRTKLPPKARSAWMPVQTIACEAPVD